MVAAISLLIGSGAGAQTAGDAHRRVDGLRVQAANAAWRRLPQSEINCVDHALHAKRSSVWLLIQQGINPSEAAGVRAACRNERQTPKQVAAVRQVSLGNVNDAPTAEYWSYDGSVLNSIAEGGAVKFFYVKPSAVLKAEGAKFGSILFEGKLADHKYVGTAYSFDGGCGRTPFQASGAIVDDNRRVELLGHRPRLDKSCKVVSNELDNLTFDRVDTAFAASGLTAIDKAATDKIETGNAAAGKAAADKVAADKAATDNAAADKAAAEKIAADKVAAEKAAAEQAAAGSVAAEKAAAAKAAGAKAAAEKIAAEKIAAQKATPSQAGPDQAALYMARAEAERAKAEALKTQADADRARREAEKAIADVGVALATAESKVSFIYGLLSGLALVGLGSAAFFVVYRQKMIGRVQIAAATSMNGGGKRSEVDRLAATVLGEQKPAVRKAPAPSAFKLPVKKPEPV
jgi:hypothetical protein